MYQEKIVDAVTGEISYRPYTDAEIAEVEAAQLQAKEISEKQKERALARAAILEKLGLSEEEAAVLLG